MSAVRSLSGEYLTWRGQRVSVEIDPKRTSTLSNRLPVKSRTVRDFAQKVMAIAVRLLPRQWGCANEAPRFHRALGWCNGGLAAGRRRTDAAKNPAGRL